MHLGHAYSALTAFNFAQRHGGRFLLRIEDIDTGRCREAFVEGIVDDLAWLGISWETPVRRQSRHQRDYTAALERLRSEGAVYPCFCTRADIAAAASAPHGEGGLRYPGTCKPIAQHERDARMAHAPYAWRLDVEKSCKTTGGLQWQDALKGAVTADPAALGDVVIARKDAGTSYHLAVVIDDALQDVTDVVRGEDLFAATHIHRLLQALLGLPTPRYHHHALVVGADGKRLAKRDKAETIAELRAAGVSAAAIRRRLGREIF